MKSNIVKKKLREGETTFGSWLSLGDLYAARVMASLGFDWLTIDMEHQPIDWSATGALCAAIADGDCVPLVRVPEGNHVLIKRALDAGAWGVVVPMVNSVDHARAMIAATKYPPLGNRSLGGGLHAMNFAASLDDYFERANDELLVVLQIESPTAVKAARDIMSLPGVDATFIGPRDLRANMRQADGRDCGDTAFEDAIASVVQVGRELGIPTGMHTMSLDVARSRAAQGMRFIAVGSELRMLATEAVRILRGLGREVPRENLGY